MPLMSSCLKDTNCFSMNWLVKGWSYGVKFPNVSSVLRIWPIFGDLHGLRVFSNLASGFRFPSTTMAVFRIVLSSAFYGLWVLPRTLHPVALLKPVQFHGTTHIVFYPLEEWITNLVCLLAIIWVVTEKLKITSKARL